jgi:1-deoxy-D-xylulose-5-phosphate synthase
MATYLTRVISDARYNKLKNDIWEMTGRMKTFGSGIRKIAGRIEESIKGVLLPGRLFEDLGFRYFGPLDGHNIEAMTGLFANVRKNIPGPVLIHVITKKGKGYKHAEINAPKFHGVSGFEKDTGETRKQSGLPTYSSVFGKTLVRIAEQDTRIIGITAAMPTGTGLEEFSKRFPDRYFDVGIAESHAITFAGGLARSGMKPVVALYSTFLQRAFDQVIHDVALQNLGVVLCIDRGGLTPDDGPTHHGAFDMSFLRLVPNMVVMAPKDEDELQHMLWTAVRLQGPVAIRYPKGAALGVPMEEAFRAIPVGEPEIVAQGNKVLLLAIGEMVEHATQAAELLKSRGITPTVVNARFVKPLSRQGLKPLLESHDHVFTLEAGTVIGGFGSAVREYADANCVQAKRIISIGFPDSFISHGNKKDLLSSLGLSAEQISGRILGELK